MDISEVIKKVGKFIKGEKKTTRYIKVVELLISVNVEDLNELLKPVFDKYEPLFGFRPYFYANNTTSGLNPRLSITIQLLSQKPDLILKYLDPFLKDFVYCVYNDLINYGIEGDK